MKIAVYGATGAAGSEVVAEATTRGHEVVALSRHAPSGELPSGATWRRGDAQDLTDVAAVAADADVVVAAFGPSREAGGNPSAFTQQFLDFAGALGGTRVIVIGGAGSSTVGDGVRLVDTPDFPEAYKAEALAHAAVLDALRDGVDGVVWAYLSPAPMLVPGERTGAYVTGTDSPVGDSISFADLAISVVDEAERSEHTGARWIVATA
jgi:putative NADH-flavin reductase